MQTCIYRTAIFTALFCLTQANISFGQFGRLTPIDPGDFPPSAPADLTLKVEVGPQITKSRAKTPRQVAYLQQVATLLNQVRIGVPNDRVQFFTKTISPNSPLVKGWHGYIEDVTPSDLGVVVTLRVHALQDHTIDSISLMEQYSIVNGEVTYIGSYVPHLPKRFIFSL